MGRPQSKSELLIEGEKGFNKLQTLISTLSNLELETEFDFSKDEKKKEAHWKRDKNLRDILIHLYEWHNLLLNWVDSNRKGEDKPFLPKPYNWKTYGDMNVEFYYKHQNTSLEQAKIMVNDSHKKVMDLSKEFTDEELFTHDVFKWVGGSVLGSYFVSTTSSHYDWAIKKLKAHQRMLRDKNQNN